MKATMLTIFGIKRFLDGFEVSVWLKDRQEREKRKKRVNFFKLLMALKLCIIAKGLNIKLIRRLPKNRNSD